MVLTDSIMASPKTDFQLLLRVFAKYIKAYHHLQHTNCSPTTETPIRLKRIQDDLTKLVRPAFPTAQTDIVKEYNAKNWMYTTLQILEEHYLSLIAGVQTEINHLSLDGWERAVQVAVSWVKKDLPGIKETTIVQATTNLKALVDKRPQPQSSIQSRPNPDPPQDLIHENVSFTTRPLEGDNVPPAKRQKKTNNLERENTPLPHTLSLTTATPETSPHKSPYFMSTNANLSPEFPPLPRLRPMTPLLDPITPRANSTPEPRLEPIPETYSFRSHAHNGDKHYNWNLTPTRPIIIAGDSNISRLPRIYDNRIQVDCYPGANLSNANNILRNQTPVSHAVTKVLLSFGLNNRTQKKPSILKKDLHGMLEAAKIAFPQAEILIPVINISEDLPKHQPVITPVLIRDPDQTPQEGTLLRPYLERRQKQTPVPGVGPHPVPPQNKTQRLFRPLRTPANQIILTPLTLGTGPKQITPTSAVPNQDGSKNISGLTTIPGQSQPHHPRTTRTTGANEQHVHSDQTSG